MSAVLGLWLWSLAASTAAEGGEQLGHAGPDGAGAHQPHGLAPQLTAHKAVFGLSLAAAGVHLRQIAQQGEGHAQGELGH